MTGQRPGGGGLGLRAASAAVLMPAALGAAYLGGPVFIAAVGVVGLFAWLELRRLLARLAADAAGVAGIAGLAVACMLFAMVGVAAAAAAVAAAALVVAGVERGRLRARAAGLAGAGIILFLVVATLALRGDDPAGRATIFWLFAVVWASDTGAYALRARRVPQSAHRRLRTRRAPALPRPADGQIEKGDPWAGQRSRLHPRCHMRWRTRGSAASPTARGPPLPACASPGCSLPGSRPGPKRSSASRNRTRPPSKEIRPPSKSAITFLDRTAGRSNGSRVSLVMTACRFRCPAGQALQHHISTQ